MMTKDPVCKMEVDEATALSYECDGDTYYFCSEGCRDTFIKELSCKVPRCSYEMIIIGGGPAGLTAGVYAAMLKVDAFLITKDLGGQAIDSTKINNYMGFDFITGPELVEKFDNQLLHSHYINHLIDEVDRIERIADGFKITTASLIEYTANVILVATGMSRRKLAVPGEEEFQRKGVFYGHVQDYSFIQEQDVAVIGGGNSALQIVDAIHALAGTIHLVSDFELSADPHDIERIDGYPNVRKYEYFAVEAFEGDDALSHVRIRKKAGKESLRLPVKGAFISIGLHANSGVTASLAETNDKGEITVNPDCSTSCPGMFAAGDVTDAFGKRIIIASGEGAKAVLAARSYLLALRNEARTNQ